MACVQWGTAESPTVRRTWACWAAMRRPGEASAVCMCMRLHSCHLGPTQVQPQSVKLSGLNYIIVSDIPQT